ncbi:MAG: M14 family metallopeptidase, partial [Planctomycetota bacterium]
MLTRLRFVVAGLVLAWFCYPGSGRSSLADELQAGQGGGSKRIIRVDMTSDQVVTGLKRVLRGWDAAGSADRGRSLDLVVTEEERQRLTAAGVQFQDLELPPAGTRATYRSFAQTEADLSAMAAAYPAITDLTSIGTSWEGRDIWCLEISDSAGVDEGEAGVVFMGLHHAREWPSLEVAMDLADRLTSGYGSDPTISLLVDNRRIWVIPCVNPDGHVYSYGGSDEWWRPNRRPYPGGVGVDLNRNYGGATDGSKDGAWGSIGDGSQMHQPGWPTYVGPWPFSELETQAIRDFFNARDVTISIAYHTHGDLVLWSWAYGVDAQTDDDTLLISIGQGMAAAIGGYTPEQGAELYPTTGSSDDWIYGYRYYELGKNTLAYTVEIGPSYHPEESLLQELLDENWDGALYVLQEAASVESMMAPFVLPPIMDTPTVDADGDFTVSWTQSNPEADAYLYGLQELTDLAKNTDDAESGAGYWIMEQFETSTSRFHSGSQSFKSPDGNWLIAAMTTAEPLPVEAGDELTFWTWYAIELDWDMAFVEVSIDGRKFDILDKFTGSTAGWEQKTYSLDAYAGRSIYLRFRYTTDGNTLEEGFYVDDVYPVASWSSSTVLATPDTWYQITGRSEGDYF